MAEWTYDPSPWVPFRDKDVLERVRKIKRADITRHANPDFRIRVLPAGQIEHLFVTDIFYRIRTAADAGRRCVLLLPNPVPSYRKAAHLVNTFRADCTPA